jgi:hypothetical protein
MNAYQPSKSPLEASEPRRVARKPLPRRRTRRYKALALETTVKLAVNLTLSVAAVAALVQLLPYHMSVQAKLKDMREETSQTQARVNRLQSDFNRSFDPQQTRMIIQGQTGQSPPGRLNVVLPTEKGDAAEESAVSPYYGQD